MGYYGRKTNINDSYLICEQDSIIKEVPHYEEEEEESHRGEYQLRKNDRMKEAINIVDY